MAGLTDTALPRFSRFVAIDWSGAKGENHPGIAVAECHAGQAAPILIAPPGRYWSRTGVRNWVAAQTDDVLIGFDFSFAPPFVQRQSYLPGEDVPDSARAFRAYVASCCDDADLGAASFLETQHRRHFYFGAADGVKADYMHFRACEAQFNAGGGGKASTVYDAIGAAQVAKASFAGMRLLDSLADQVPVWPFDTVPDAGPLIVEIYTRIAAQAAGIGKGRSKVRTAEALDSALGELQSAPHAPLERYVDHATDALITAAWLRKVAGDKTLWSPDGLTPEIARTEGWTFGVR